MYQEKAELIAYEDLGAEALRKLYVEDMPLFVIIDCEGNNLYDEGRKAYLDTQDKIKVTAEVCECANERCENRCMK